jgi:GNAT superfamily N-acetyltransferase
MGCGQATLKKSRTDLFNNLLVRWVVHMSYSIRRATPADHTALSTIERAAAEMFRHTPHPQMADAPLACEHLGAGDEVWVVVDAQDQPVGFAIVRAASAVWHLQEIDVHPAHARRGLGAQLIAAIAHEAAAQGVPALTLSTCDDIPWNAPYYARLGFRALSSAELSAELRAVRCVEAAAGLPMQHRVCMRMKLQGRSDAS